MGAGRAVGGVRERPRRQCRPLEAASRRCRSDSPDVVRGQRVAAAVVARWSIHRVPLRARWRRPLRHARERRGRTPRLELRLRAALVAGWGADPVQAFGGAAGSAHHVRGGSGWKAAAPRPARRDRSIPIAPRRLASGRRAPLHLGDHAHPGGPIPDGAARGRQSDHASDLRSGSAGSRRRLRGTVRVGPLAPAHLLRGSGGRYAERLADHRRSRDRGLGRRPRPPDHRRRRRDERGAVAGRHEAALHEHVEPDQAVVVPVRSGQRPRHRRTVSDQQRQHR